jgi:hypothetical protein
MRLLRRSPEVAYSGNRHQFLISTKTPFFNGVLNFGPAILLGLQWKSAMGGSWLYAILNDPKGPFHLPSVTFQR